MRLALVLAVLVACSAHKKIEPKTIKVAIRGMQFAPDRAEVQSGDTVVWTNEDIVPHSATAENKAFDSGALSGGQSFSYVVQQAGELKYTCSFHPTMKATINVGPAQ